MFLFLIIPWAWAATTIISSVEGEANFFKLTFRGETLFFEGNGEVALLWDESNVKRGGLWWKASDRISKHAFLIRKNHKFLLLSSSDDKTLSAQLKRIGVKFMEWGKDELVEAGSPECQVHLLDFTVPLEGPIRVQVDFGTTLDLPSYEPDLPVISTTSSSSPMLTSSSAPMVNSQPSAADSTQPPSPEAPRSFSFRIWFGIPLLVLLGAFLLSRPIST